MKAEISAVRYDQQATEASLMAINAAAVDHWSELVWAEVCLQDLRTAVLHAEQHIFDDAAWKSWMRQIAHGRQVRLPIHTGFCEPEGQRHVAWCLLLPPGEGGIADEWLAQAR